MIQPSFIIFYNWTGPGKAEDKPENDANVKCCLINVSETHCYGDSDARSTASEALRLRPRHDATASPARVRCFVTIQASLLRLAGMREISRFRIGFPKVYFGKYSPQNSDTVLLKTRLRHERQRSIASNSTRAIGNSSRKKALSPNAILIGASRRYRHY